MHYQSERKIGRPRAEVFRAFTDLERVPTRVEGIERLEVLTEGPMQVGTRFRETRKMFGREATEEMTVTEFTELRGYVATAESCGARYRAEYTFDDAADGTKVSFTFEAKPVTFMAKVMTPITGPLARRMMKKCFEKDMDDLTAAIEGGR